MTPASPKRLLFVCVENSNRSQMAQAFAKLDGGEQVEAYSAGSRPSGRINPRAVAAMQELGYDLTTHQSLGIEAVPPGEFDAVISMGCGDACPQIPAKRREDWPIPDPRVMDAEQFRQVRDLIRANVNTLLGEL